jgi:cell division protein FtsL
MARSSDLYYIDGSVVRKRETAVPKRRVEPARVPQRRPKTYKKAARKAENSKGFDLRYTLLLSVMFVVMIVSCVIMLTVQGSVETKERKIENLQEELQSLQADNSAYENSLNNMYSLEDIYSIATGELGMVYSQNGQIRYYESAEGDYVKQYGDVPKTSY